MRQKTRKHSSRMGTVRFSSFGGGLPNFPPPPDADPLGRHPWRQTAQMQTPRRQTPRQTPRR